MTPRALAPALSVPVVVEVRDALRSVDVAEVHEPYVDHDRIDGVYYGPVEVGLDQLLVLGDARGDRDACAGLAP